MTTKELRQVLDWNDEGVLQWKNSAGVWIDVQIGKAISNSEEPFFVTSNELFSYYRRKPTPKLRPWKPEEVPMPCVLRNKTTGIKYTVLSVIDRGLYTINNGKVVITYFCDLVSNTEHSLDNGKTWLPCGVME